MSNWSPTGAYRPGSGILHRLRPGAKLLGLIAFAIAVVWARGVPSTIIALVIAFVFTFAARLSDRDYVRILRGFALVALLLFAFQAWLNGWERGVEVVGDLFALILAATALTASTAVDDMQQTIIWAIGPLRPLRAKPERVALAFSLVLGAIPHLFGLAHETRAAAKARGLERNPRALLVPFALRTVAHAQLTGEALHARGLGDDD